MVFLSIQAELCPYERVGCFVMKCASKWWTNILNIAKTWCNFLPKLKKYAGFKRVQTDMGKKLGNNSIIWKSFRRQKLSYGWKYDCKRAARRHERGRLWQGWFSVFWRWNTGNLLPQSEFNKYIVSIPLNFLLKACISGRLEWVIWSNI